jgi:hypothetical protein
MFSKFAAVGPREPAEVAISAHSCITPIPNASCIERHEIVA